MLSAVTYSCKKAVAPYVRPFKELDYDITNIYASTFGEWKDIDTGKNISDLLFATIDSFKYVNDTLAVLDDHAAGCYSTWFPSSDKHVYSIRYIPDVPLIDSGGYADTGFVRCPINPALSGKELFEVVDTTVGKVYSKIFARRNVFIKAGAPLQSPNLRSIIIAYNHYFQKFHTVPIYVFRIPQ